MLLTKMSQNSSSRCFPIEQKQKLFMQKLSQQNRLQIADCHFIYSSSSLLVSSWSLSSPNIIFAVAAIALAESWTSKSLLMQQHFPLHHNLHAVLSVQPQPAVQARQDWLAPISISLFYRKPCQRPRSSTRLSTSSYGSAAARCCSSYLDMSTLKQQVANLMVCRRLGLVVGQDI